MGVINPNSDRKVFFCVYFDFNLFISYRSVILEIGLCCSAPSLAIHINQVPNKRIFCCCFLFVVVVFVCLVG